MNKAIRVFAVAASASLLVGALVGPADAKKKKKPKAPVACPAFAPTEYAPDAATTVVTDAATADAPVEVKLATHEGLGFTNPDGHANDEGSPSHTYQNVQVDTAGAEKTLVVRIEFTEAFDYDLFLRNADETSAAYEADFNPATAGGPTPLGGYGEATAGPGWSELNGVATPDCGGYTVDVAGGITPGEEVTVKIWLK
jgi:hypothetical protein